jgi:hypothetical protein
MQENQEKQVTAKKTWMTPTLTVHGDVARLTRNGIPQKTFGGSDGAIWSQQQVKWGS